MRTRVRIVAAGLGAAVALAHQCGLLFLEER
jgi:hypothetical protein